MPNEESKKPSFARTRKLSPEEIEQLQRRAKKDSASPTPPERPKTSKK
ncbi:MAG: hypothetical protein ACRETN_07665 [Nevskiales bacterium]